VTEAAPASHNQNAVRIEPANILALAISVLVQGCLVAVLLDKASLPGNHEREELIVRATFIAVPTPAGTPAATKRMSRTSDGRTARPLVRRHAYAPMPTRLDIPPADTTLPSATGNTLNLSIPAAPMAFERDILDRPGVPAQAAVSRLHVRIQDRSLAGRLNSLSKRRNCGELRAALSTHPESTAAIMGAMEQQGCIENN